MVRPLLVQVSAGLAGTVVLGGSIMLLLGMVAAPQPVLANDEPLGALTAPHYLYSTVSPGDIVTAHDTSIVVEASVDAAGRVYDFTIVSGPQDEASAPRWPISFWAACFSRPAHLACPSAAA